MYVLGHVYYDLYSWFMSMDDVSWVTKGGSTDTCTKFCFYTPSENSLS